MAPYFIDTAYVADLEEPIASQQSYHKTAQYCFLGFSDNAVGSDYLLLEGTE